MTETRTEWRVTWEQLYVDTWLSDERNLGAGWRKGDEPFTLHLRADPECRNVRVQQRTVTEWVDA